MRHKPKIIPVKNQKIADETAKAFDLCFSDIKESLPPEFKPKVEEMSSLFGVLYGLVNGAEPVKDSENSSEPPAGDKAKPTKEHVDTAKRMPGGQKGHEGKVIEQFDNPDESVPLTKDREKYENDPDWRKVKTIKRQVVDINAARKVTEYSVDVYENVITGERVSGDFPEGIDAPFQYGPNLIAHILLLREQGMLSFEQIATIVNSQYGTTMSESTVANIVRKAENSPVVMAFEEAAKIELQQAELLNTDETSVSVNGKNYWYHLLASSVFTLFFFHPKRGKEAIDDLGILENFRGYLVHDCWQSYFNLSYAIHCLCNAHIIRELVLAIEMRQAWAQRMHDLLMNVYQEVYCYGGVLPMSLQIQIRKAYKAIIASGLAETGGETLARPPGRKRGKIAKPKYRNLLERLNVFEDAILRFMTDKIIPFSNNSAEQPMRMVKVHMKVSGCFREPEYARGFCRMRGYIVSCQKNGINPAEALAMVAKGQIPVFIMERLAKG